MAKLKSFSQLCLPAEVEALRKKLAEAEISLAAKTEQLKDLREKYRIAFTALDAIMSSSSDARDVAQAREAMQACVDFDEGG